MRSQRPRGEDLDRHDLTAWHMRFLYVFVCVWLFLCNDLCGCTEESVAIYEIK